MACSLTLRHCLVGKLRAQDDRPTVLLHGGERCTVLGVVHSASTPASRLLRRFSRNAQALKAELKGSIQKGVEFVNKDS